MEFIVNFRGTANRSAITRSNRLIGTNGVDLVRKALGIHISLDRINEANSGIYCNPNICIAEDIARCSEHFAESNQVRVVASPSVLDHFIREVVYTDTDNNTGEIRSAWIADNVDEDALVSAWIAAGYPLKWDTAPSAEGIA